MMPLDCRTDSEQEVREQERGSEPFGIGEDALPVLDIEPTEGELLGIFPHRFEGGREHTQLFLKQFKQFMMMNRNAFIARDPIAHCLYFFSLLKGPEAELWVERNDSWLLEVESDPSLLTGKSAWDILEEDFKKSFVNYAGPERAFMDIQKLKMKEDKVDEHITTFKSLGRHAGMNLDNPSALQMFARGLPRKLADTTPPTTCTPMPTPTPDVSSMHMAVSTHMLTWRLDAYAHVASRHVRLRSTPSH